MRWAILILMMSFSCFGAADLIPASRLPFGTFLALGAAAALVAAGDATLGAIVTLSLQVSSMLFLLFLVLAVLSEYLGRVLGESRRRPTYVVRDEQASSVLVASEDKFLQALGRQSLVPRAVAHALAAGG